MGRAMVNATMVNKLLLLIYQNFHLSLPHKQFRHLTKAASWPLFFFVVVALGVFHNRLERTTNSTEEQALRLSICARSVSALSLAAVPCRNKWNNKSKEPWEKMWCHFFAVLCRLAENRMWNVNATTVQLFAWETQESGLKWQPSECKSSWMSGQHSVGETVCAKKCYVFPTSRESWLLSL